MFALPLLAGDLWCRKRLAWLITLIVLSVDTAVQLLNGRLTIQTLLSVILTVWLPYLSPEYHARSDTPSMRQGLMTLAAAMGFTLTYGAIGFYLLDLHFKFYCVVGVLVTPLLAALGAIAALISNARIVVERVEEPGADGQ